MTYDQYLKIKHELIDSCIEWKTSLGSTIADDALGILKEP
jgi:hypothetical protein